MGCCYGGLRPPFLRTDDVDARQGIEGHGEWCRGGGKAVAVDVEPAQRAEATERER